MLIHIKWNTTKICTLYRNFESFITVIFPPALFNYSECSSEVSSDSLSHSEFEASSRLLHYCHLALNLPHWISNLLKKIFWSYCPALLAKLLKSIPLLLKLIPFYFATRCQSMIVFIQPSIIMLTVTIFDRPLRDHLQFQLSLWYRWNIT
jgi:hypothetical protein